MHTLLPDAELTDAPILKAWSKDLKASARMLTSSEVRFLVDLYYTTQEHRIATAAQVRASAEDEEPNAVIGVLFDAAETVELRIKQALDIYTAATPVGVWLKSIYGIGPVLAAGFLAHIDITKAPTVGHIWNYAGLNPAVQWEKGQKRPWNAHLKVLTWKAGESFVKFCNRDECIYGRLYAERKCQEIDRNDANAFAEQAANVLAAKKIGKETDAYASYSIGKLPPAHIHARAKRYAVKMLLSHLHEVMYWLHYQALPPKPFAIEHLGHAHYLPVPNMQLVPGLKEVKARKND